MRFSAYLGPLVLLLATPFLSLAPATLACAGTESSEIYVPTEEPTPVPPPDRRVTLPQEATGFALPFDQKTLEALRKREYGLAETRITGMDLRESASRAPADRAFLLAWIRYRLGRSSQALPLLEAFADSTAPEPYRKLLSAQLLLERSRDPSASAAARKADRDTALELLAGIDAKDSAIGLRARLLLGANLAEQGRTDEARALYEEIASASDPTRGVSTALLRLASLERAGSERRHQLLRRIWTAYPTSDEAAEAEKVLREFEAKGARFKPSLLEIALRADALQEDGEYTKAVELLTPHLARYAMSREATPEACAAWYALGRAQSKLKRVEDSVRSLEPVGERCADVDPSRSAKALYLAARGRERRKEWGAAGKLYERIPELHPEDSLADDGHALGGIALLESGDTEGARRNWTRQLEHHADGDLAGEAFLRLALGYYLEGDVARAIAWAERGKDALSLQGSPMYHWAVEYWSARWLLYPDVSAPDRLTDDPLQRERGIDALLRFCVDHPANLYTILAASRLAEIAPERLATLPGPGWGRPTGPDPWQARARVLDGPFYAHAVALARLGLFSEALAEWRRVDADALEAGEIGPFLELMTASGDWLWAHDRGHTWALSHPAEVMGANEARFLALSHPRRYEAETRAACAEHRFDFRLFHALVREESNFNESIVSHAGARGLSQLMPTTARIVGRWMNVNVGREQMFEPAMNLRIGARYLAFLLDRYRGDPFLSLAGYNAGEGSVDRWLREKGNRPVDEFIESIPFRETRHYVKRVSTTWQVYHLVYDGGDPYQAFPAYNHRAIPDVDPRFAAAESADSGLDVLRPLAR